MKQIATAARLAGGASSALLVAALATCATAALFAATSLAPTDTGLVQTAHAANSIDMVGAGGKYKVGKVSMRMDMREHLKFRYGNGKARTAKYKMNRALSNGRYIIANTRGNLYSDALQSVWNMKGKNAMYRIDPKNGKAKKIAVGNYVYLVYGVTNRYIHPKI